MQPTPKPQPAKKIIAIKSAWSESLGMGHIQRMTALLWFLNQKDDMTAVLVADSMPESFPENLLYYIKSEIDIEPDLIISDMRDSSAEDIKHLKVKSPVLVIDDNGEGRSIADFKIDLLPNPEISNNEYPDSRKDFFIYGYNFISSLAELGDRKIETKFDFTIYPGNRRSGEHTDLLLSLLPENSTVAVLGGSDPCILKEGEWQNIGKKSYAEIFLSSKIILSHFGITLYEGSIAGCKLISINPTPYHDTLSCLEKENLDLVNLGVRDRLNKKEASATIASVLNEAQDENIPASKVYQKTIENLENFYIFLKGLI